MNSKIKHFIAYTILARFFHLIIFVTSFVRFFTMKIAWLVILVLGFLLIISYNKNNNFTAFFDDSDTFSTLIGLALLVTYNVLQPNLIHLFAWIVHGIGQNKPESDPLE